jgi:acyl-CoA thioester hydrolase
VRVYYEDTDAGGVVYHAGYLRYMERARTEWLRHLGHSQHELRAREGLLFAVNRITINYRKPARIDELLEVRSTLIDRGAASLVFGQIILNERGAVLCDAEVGVACLNAADMKPRRLPNSIRMELHDVN